MVKCEECGKKLGVFKGYSHPVLGKNQFLCKNCFDDVADSVEKWKVAVLPYVDFFKNDTSDVSLESNWINKKIDNLHIKKENIYYSQSEDLSVKKLPY